MHNMIMSGFKLKVMKQSNYKWPDNIDLKFSRKFFNLSQISFVLFENEPNTVFKALSRYAQYDYE